MSEINNPLHIILEHKEKSEEKKASYWTPQKIDLVKWLVGTIVLGVIGIVINNKIQNTELELKRIEADASIIDAVSTRFDTTDASRYKYLNYIKHFVSTDSLKVATQKAIDILFLELKSVKDEADRVTNKSVDIVRQKVTQKQAQEFRSQATENAASAKDPATNLQPINILKQKEDQIAGENLPSIETKAIELIEESKTITTPKTSDNYVLSGSPQTLWCKQGYYVVFNNLLRVGVNQLNNNEKTVVLNFIDLEGGKEEEILIRNSPTTTLSVGQRLEVIKSPYKYIVTLDYIGPAGKNPFTKAAYITVATYRK